MGTNCNLTWREYGEKERLWICNPAHPICDGLNPYIELEMEEMYGESFLVPSPDETLFRSWFEGGETFRSGLLYKRGNGNIFYFRPGHETYPTYFNKNIQKILNNMREENFTHVVMEVSSHALDQNRVADINFNIAAFTNLTPEHLDYHSTIENYFHSKMKLFKNLNKNSTAIINMRDQYGKRLAKETEATIVPFLDINGSSIFFKNLIPAEWSPAQTLALIKAALSQVLPRLA